MRGHAVRHLATHIALHVSFRGEASQSGELTNFKVGWPLRSALDKPLRLFISSPLILVAFLPGVAFMKHFCESLNLPPRRRRNRDTINVCEKEAEQLRDVFFAPSKIDADSERVSKSSDAETRISLHFSYLYLSRTCNLIRFLTLTLCKDAIK